MTELLFKNIVDKKIPADIVYQDDLVTAFRDINPQAKVHILIIPNEIIPTSNDLKDDHKLVIGKMFLVAKELAKKEGIAESGYRLIINCNKDGRQEIYHLHLHLVGGQDLGKMLNC